MPFIQKLLKVEKNFSWSFFSFILAIIFGVIALYSTFIYKRKVNLRYEILSNTNVLDVREELGKLIILYDNINIKDKNQSLRIFTIKIQNGGSLDILKSSYDNDEPLGLSIKDGQIVEIPKILETSNDYIKRNLKISIDSTYKIIYSDIIIESSQYFVVKILVLHQKDYIPQIIPCGKIAGIQKIELIDSSKQLGQISFLSRLFSGNLLIQIIRSFTYFIIFILLLVIIIAPPVKITTLIGKNKRRNKVNKFKLITKLNLSKKDDNIFNMYIEDGDFILNNINILLQNKDRIILAYKYFEIEKEMLSKSKELIGLKDDLYIERHLNNYELRIIRSAIEKGFIKKQKDEIIINNNLKRTLFSFLKFISRSTESNK